jgi:hypothetical protein
MRGGPVLILGLLVIGFVIWAVIAGLSSLVNEVSKTITENRQRRFEKKKRIALEKEKMEAERRQRQAEAALEKEKRQIEDFRAAHPVRIVGGPNLALLPKISGQLDEFIRVVKSCRPSIPPYDDRFSSVTFSNPFGFFFPRKNFTDDGPDPGPWETTPDVLAIKAGRPLRPIYTGLGNAAEFRAKEPVIAFDPPRPPQLPTKMGLPSWSIKIVENQTGGEIDLRVENLKKVYAKEIEEAERLQRAADDLQEVIKPARSNFLAPDRKNSDQPRTGGTNQDRHPCVTVGELCPALSSSFQT